LNGESPYPIAVILNPSFVILSAAKNLGILSPPANYIRSFAALRMTSKNGLQLVVADHPIVEYDGWFAITVSP
jgi:hypothetical protein